MLDEDVEVGGRLLSMTCGEVLSGNGVFTLVVTLPSTPSSSVPHHRTRDNIISSNSAHTPNAAAKLPTAACPRRSRGTTASLICTSFLH